MSTPKSAKDDPRELPSPGTLRSTATRTMARTNRSRKSVGASVAFQGVESGHAGNGVSGTMFALLDTTMSAMNNEVEEIHNVSVEHGNMIEAGANYMKFTFAKLVMICGAKMKRHNCLKRGFHKWQRVDDLSCIAQCKAALADHADRIEYLSHQVRNTPALEAKLAETITELQQTRKEKNDTVKEHTRDVRIERERLHRLDGLFHSQDEAIADVEGDNHTWGEALLSPARHKEAEETFKRLWTKVELFHRGMDELKALATEVDDDDIMQLDESNEERGEEEESEEEMVDEDDISEVDLIAAEFAEDAASIEEAARRENEEHRDKMKALFNDIDATENRRQIAEDALNSLGKRRNSIVDQLREADQKVRKTGMLDPQNDAARDKAKSELERLEKREKDLRTEIEDCQADIGISRQKERKQQAAHTERLQTLQSDAEMNKALQNSAAKETVRYKKEKEMLKKQQLIPTQNAHQFQTRAKKLSEDRKILIAKLTEEEKRSKNPSAGKKEDFRVVAARKKQIREHLAQIEAEELDVSEKYRQSQNVLQRLNQKEARERESHIKILKEALIGRKAAATQSKATKEKQEHEHRIRTFEDELNLIKNKRESIENTLKDLESRRSALLVGMEQDAIQRSKSGSLLDSTEDKQRQIREQKDIEDMEKERTTLQDDLEGLDTARKTLQLQVKDENAMYEASVNLQMQEVQAIVLSADQIVAKLRTREERQRDRAIDKEERRKRRQEANAMARGKRQQNKEKEHAPRSIHDAMGQLKDAITSRDSKIAKLQEEVKTLREGKIQVLEAELEINRRQVKIYNKHQQKTIKVFASRLRLKNVYCCFHSWNAFVSENRAHTRLLTRFRALWDGNILKRIINIWRDYIKAEVRSKHIIKRFGVRFLQSLAFKTFNAWATDTKREIRYRVIMKRTAARLQSAGLLRCLLRWSGMKDDRLLARKTVKRWFDRVVLSSYFWGFNSIKDSADRFKEEQDEQEQAEQLARKMESKAKGFIARLLANKNIELFDCWYQFTQSRMRARNKITRVGRSRSRREMKHILRLLSWQVKETLKTQLADAEKIYEEQGVQLLQIHSKSLERFTKMLQLSSLMKVWKGWLSFLTMKRNSESLQQNVRHCFALINDISLELVFDSWKKWTRQSNLEVTEIPLELRKRIAGFLGMINVNTVFIAWMKRTRTSLYQFLMAEAYIKRKVREWISKVFQIFASEISRTKREQFIILRMKTRWNNMFIISVLTAWSSYTKHKKFLCKFLIRYIDRHKREVLAIWRRSARDLATLEGESIMEQKIVMIYTRRKELKVQISIFHAWVHLCMRIRIENLRSQAQEMTSRMGSLEIEKASIRDKALKKFRAVFQKNGVMGYFNTWTNLWRKRVSGKQIAEAMMRKKLLAVRSAQFAAWRDYCDEEKRLRLILIKTQMKVERLLLIRIVVSWKENMLQEKRNKDIVLKVSTRLKQSGLIKALNSWITYWQDIVHHRNLARRVFTRMMNQKLFISMRSWSYFVAFRREEERIADADDEAQVKAERESVIKNLNEKLASATEELERLRIEHVALKDLAQIQNVEAQTRNDNFLRKMMTRIFSKKAYDGFRLWVIATRGAMTSEIQSAQDRKFLKKIMNRMFNRQASVAISQWQKLVDRQRADEQFLRKFMLRMLSVQISSAFNQWRMNCEGIKKENRDKSFLRMIMMRMLNRKLSQSFLHWGKVVNQNESRDRFLRKFMIRMLCVQRKTFFRHWHKISCDRYRDKDFLKKFIIRIFHAQYRRAFQQWKSAGKEKLWQTRFLRKFLIRMLNLQTRRAFISWTKQGIVIASNRTVVFRFFTTYRRRMLSSALKLWIVGDNAIIVFKKQQTYATSALVRRMMARKIDMAYRQWIHVLNEASFFEKKKSLIRRLCYKRQHSIFCLSWKLWTLGMQDRKFLRKFVERMIKGREGTLLRYYLRQWTKIIHSLAMDTTASRIISRLLETKQWHIIRGRYMLWLSASRKHSQDKHTFRVVEVFFRKTNHRLLFRVFLAWADFCDSNQHERELLKNVTNRLRQRNKFLAFAEWAGEYRRHRQESHHVKMLKERWTRLMIQKVYYMWVDYINNCQRIRLIFDKAQALLASQDRRKYCSAFKTWATRITSIAEFEAAISKVRKRWELMRARVLLTWCVSSWKDYLHGIRRNLQSNKYIAALVSKTSTTFILRVLFIWRCMALQARNFRKLVKRVIINIATSILQTSFRQWKRNDDSAMLHLIHSKQLRSSSVLKIRAFSIMKVYMKEKCHWAFLRWCKCTNLSYECHIILRLRMIVSRFMEYTFTWRVKLSVKIWKHYIECLKNVIRERTFALNGLCLRSYSREMRRVLYHWSTVVFKNASIKKKMNIIYVLMSSMKRASTRAQKKRALTQWMLMSSALHYASKSVKELNRYLLISSDRISSAFDAPALCRAVYETLKNNFLSLKQLNAGGSLIFVNEAEGNLWTMVGGELVTRSVATGILGYVIGTGECAIIHNIYQDHRYNPEVDDVLVRSAALEGLFADTLFSPRQRALRMFDSGTNKLASHKSRFQRAVNKAQAGKQFNRGPENGNPVGANVSSSQLQTSVLLIPLKDLSGNTLGILSAVIAREEDTIDGFFGPDDIALMALLSAHVSKIIETLTAAAPYGPSADFKQQRIRRVQTLRVKSPLSHAEINNLEPECAVSLADRVMAIESQAASSFNAEVAISGRLNNMAEFAHGVDETLNFFDGVHSNRVSSFSHDMKRKP